MSKSVPVRTILAGIALAAGTGLAVAIPAMTASANSGPENATGAAVCTGDFGTGAVDTMTGCTATAGTPKITPTGVSVLNSNGTSATIFWTNNKFTTETFTVTPVANTCPTLLGYAATVEEQVTTDITGGNSDLATGPVSGTANVCVYIDGSQVVVQNLTNIGL